MHDLRTLQLLRADVNVDLARGQNPSRVRRAVLLAGRLAFAPPLQAVVLTRLAAAAHRRSAALGAAVKWANYVLTHCDIAAAADIGPGLRLPHPTGVVIGPDVTIGADCLIAQHATLGMGATGSPTLEHHVQVGAGAVIFGGIRVGAHARVGANSVLWSDVPPGMIAAGAPAKPKGRWSGAPPTV